jgi:hypothetical protein
MQRPATAKQLLTCKDTQGPGKVAICAKCSNVPVTGIWLPAWTNAVAWHRATTWVSDK